MNPTVQWMLMGLLSCGVWLASGQAVWAQRVVSTQGEARVEVQQNMTLEQARRKAQDLAILDALENAFGTSIVLGTLTRMQDEVGTPTEGAQGYFNLIADTYVKGEWLGTEQLSFRTVQGPGMDTPDGVFVECQISGQAREITEPRPQLEIESLNCPSLSCKTVRFLDGDPLYLALKSPVDGYVQVYLEDADSVYVLLPYLSMPRSMSSALRISAQKQYVLFSGRPEHNYFENPGFQEDELELFTDAGATQAHRLYIVFSAQMLAPPMARQARPNRNRYVTPRSTTASAFHTWLNQRKRFTTGVFVQTLDVLVVKR
jgi:hypothetical protein